MAGGRGRFQKARLEMERQRLAGGLWIAAGVCCAGLFAVFLGENTADPMALVRAPGLPALVLGGAIAGLLLGVRLATRPTAGVVRASTAVGVVWLLAFGSLALTALSGTGEVGPKVSSTLIGALGVAAAVVAYVVHARSGARSTQSAPLG